MFENIVNYEVKIFTTEEFSDFFHNKYGHSPIYDLKKKIHYFDWHDFNSFNSGSEKHNKSKIFI